MNARAAKLTSLPTRKTAIAQLVAQLFVGGMALGAAMPASAVSCTWNPLTGNWSVATLWSCNAVPGAADSATVAGTKTVTINSGQSILNLTNAGSVNIDAFLLSLSGGGSTINTGTINVGAGPNPNNAALQIGGGHNITNTGGVINVSADSVLNQFGSVITGGTINTTGTGRVTAFNSGANYLDGVTLNGTLDVATGTGLERIRNGFTLNGNANINNGSLINLEGTQTIAGTGSFVFGATGNNRLGVDGGNATTTLGANITVRGTNGTIGLGQLVNGSGNTLINQGLISSDSGGTISLAGAAFVNQNIIEATGAGSVLRLDTTVNNAGGTLRSMAGGVVLQNGVTVTGGNITNSGGATYQISNSGSNLLSGVTLTSGSTIDMASAPATGRVINGMTVNGTVNINNSSLLNFEGNQTLAGTGSIVFGATGNNRVGVDGGGKTLTIASGMTIQGQNGTVGIGQLVNGSGNAIVNNGTISANVAGGTIAIAGLDAGITNNGTISALNGGTVALQSNLIGGAGGQLLAGAGSVISQQAVTISGIVNTSGGGNLRPTNSGSNILSGVTLNGNLDMATAQATERVINNMALNGAININNSSLLNFEGTQALSGNGTIIFGATGNNRVGVDGGNKTLTVASTVTIRGENGTIGVGQLVNGSGNALVNNGTISADVNGGVITLAGLTGGLTNNGTISALNGGTLQLQTNLTGSPGGQLVAGAGSVISQQGVTISGVINTSGGGNLRPTNSGSNILSGVTLNGNLDMATAQATERVMNNLVLNGTVNINSGSLLNFEGDQTLSGTGSIVLGAATSNKVGVDGGNKTLTVANGVTIRGENGTIGLGQLVNGSGNTLINQGLIRSDSGGTISLAGAAFVNQNIIEATGAGSVLRLDTTVNNTGGTLRSTAGGVVLQNGVTLTGGNITNSGAGTYQISNSGSNFLSGVTLTGGSTIDMATATAIGRVINGTTVNGTVNINNGSLLNMEGNQTLAGTGSIVFGATGNNRVGVDGGGKTLMIASGTTISGVNGSIGLGQLVNGSGNAIVNNGTINSNGGGTIAIAGLDAGLTNNGLLRAQNGTLNVSTALSGSGTLQVDANGVMNLANGAKTQGTLAMGATGAALNLGTGNLTINTDYANVGAGTGNAFNRRAGVTGAGLIVSGGDAAQAITGATVTNGATANATLTINNVRVGATTYNYQVANTGATGPSLRGAIQTAVNGGNITDARLSGAGVIASNYNTGAPGSNTGNLGVTFTAATAGTLAPLSGQVLNLRSNFENIADQKLNIVLGAGAAAFNAAGGNATPSPTATVANQRVGGSNSTILMVTNTAAPGSFSEDLNASFGASTAAASGSGSIAGRLAGTSNTGAGAMAVAVNTGSAGAKSGTVTLNYEAAGAVNGASNGLGTASVGSQTITVNGNVYQTATGAIQTATLNFGNVQVNQAVNQSLVIRNTATGPTGFVEDLNAAFATGVGTDSRITGSGSLNGILASSNSSGSNGAMTVSVNTSSAGSVNGTIRVNYTSAGAVNGVSNGLGTLGAGFGDYAAFGTIVQGNVIDQARPVINGIAHPGSVNFNLGNVRMHSAASQNLTVLNQATGNQQANLHASIATNGAPVTAGGTISGLAPGATSTNLQVGLNTSSAGNKSGSATVSLVSDITAFGNCSPNCTMNLLNQTVNVSGAVYREAAVATTSVTPSITLAARVGGAASGAITVTNNSVDGFTEGLNVTRVTTAAGFTSSGGITNLAANASSSAIGVALNTGTAGTFSGNQVLALASNGTITGNGNDALGNVNVTLNGKVYTTAVGQVAPATMTVDFGIVRVNDVVGTRNVTVQNTANVTLLNDSLRGTLSVAGPFTTASNTIGGIGAGASGSIAVGLNTSTAGISNLTGSVAFLSQDADLADASAGANASVLFKAQVNNLANAHFGLFSGVGVLTQAGNVFTLDLGNIFLGSSRAATLRLDNFITGPADDLSRGRFDLTSANDFSFSGFGPLGTLAAGQFSGNLDVSYLASALGMFNDTIFFDGFSTNASGPDIAERRQLIVNANVINVNAVPEPGTLALLLLAAAGAALARRRRTMAH